MVISSNIYFHPYLGEWYNLRSIFFKWCGQNPWTHQEYQPQTIASWCFISSLAGSISNQGTNFLTAGPSPLLWSSQALGKISKGSRVDPIVAGVSGFWYEFDGPKSGEQQVQYPKHIKKHNSMRYSPYRLPDVEPIKEYCSGVLFHLTPCCSILHDEPFARFDHFQWPLLWKTDGFFVWKSTIFLMSVSQLLIEHWKQGPWLV